MDATQIEHVRRFNRAITQRVGALDDRFLDRDRPLGASRVLWEIGPTGCDVRRLRSRLGLDSGYLSRLLRSLEQAGFVAVVPAEGDRRVRTARLTDAGLEEWAVLDRRSDDLADSMLAPLDGAARETLVEAMHVVERLITASAVEIRRTDPAHSDARRCLAAYFAELDARFDTGFDPGASISAADDELRPPAGLLLVGVLHGEPVGCGALKFHDDGPAELKRMWVDASVRGLGIGRRLLAALESEAIDDGVSVVHLETNRSLAEAMSLYRHAGYVEVAAFNDEPYAHHWFEKRLTAS